MNAARALLPNAVRGRLLVTLKLGEMPAHIPGWRACTRYGADMADRIDGGIIDRLLRHHGGALRAVRLHSARTSRNERAVAGAYRFDDVEQISGVARVLRVQVREAEGVPALLQALAELPMVERVAANALCRAPFAAASAADAGERPVARPDAEAGAWARRCTRIDEALRYEGGDPAVVLGLADTGVSLAHVELLERVRAGFDSVDLDPEAVGGVTLVGDYRHPGQRPQDEVGHGSGCAGIIAARGNRMPPGAAGACGLTPVRVLGAALGPGDKRVGIGALDNIDAGMKRLIDLGVKVINMSFGTPESMLDADAPRPHEEIVRYALSRGVVLVAASGNSGLTERYFPAAHPGVIAVGAIGPDLKPASFSTRGDHVALCAPGRDILTCGLDGYQHASGTSFAAPHVAAICALLASRAQRRAWPLSGEDARRLLIASARPFAEAGVVGCGHGVLDAYAALRMLDAEIDRSLREDAESDSEVVPPALAAA
ncbi:MAG: S8 family peptidase [Pseudomonadota bacterium]